MPGASLPAGPPDWAGVFSTAETGIVRLDTIDCRGLGGTATGFLVDSQTVGTVAHAVEGNTLIRVTSPRLGVTALGTPIGVDHKQDLALLHLSRPMPGHVFQLAATAPQIGTEIGMLGFSLGRSLRGPPATSRRCTITARLRAGMS